MSRPVGPSPPASRRCSRPRSALDVSAGFSLIELMITLIVFAVATIGLTVVLRTSVASRTATLGAADARQKAAAALDMITRDLREAGSGTDAGHGTPQPAIAYIDSSEVMLCADFSGGAAGLLDTLAYHPSGTPKPFKLTGAYAPPAKYRTGAELIRWTMDLNNDGIVGAGDIAASDGVNSQRTPNPRDYTLVRQIYGDSLNAIAQDNGGAVSRVAPILPPGGSVPALFTVNFIDGTTWAWASGPVPAASLGSIASIGVHVTAESGYPDTRGRYARITVHSTVSLRRLTF